MNWRDPNWESAERDAIIVGVLLMTGLLYLIGYIVGYFW